ncbi:Gfo/Idh/MocA family protein [Shimia sp. Alg240-R146]|uniref:Gfo/Idh/MocA family protein n=1 Tax=Shimia sp. Alg240-R146 TaxID=2993449 RepID=UPI0022E28D0E|nr:Gfo/Idh/MocA family oxidoreductase [Shimia sp. Alg240-R146]
MSNAVNVGIIGCGNISTTYMRMGQFFRDYKVVACADLNMEAAKARAAEFGLRALSIEDLLADPEIEIVVNLTIPNAHFEVSSNILKAGKHVYSEKPFVLTADEGAALKALAEEKGLRIGSAPDTFMGGSHQKAREMIDSGEIGAVTSGTIHVMSGGMEHWHPNPDFFFEPGAGPIFDLAPYYLSNLVQLLGPVSRVVAMSSTPNSHRTIGCGPRNGEKIPVTTPTTVHSILQFANGAVISYGTSWDVKDHGHSNMELYGQEGTLYVPDPNFFGGPLRLAKGDGSEAIISTGHPFSQPNDGDNANYRGAGLADMAAAIREGHAHRCNNDLAGHVVEVMGAILEAGETGQAVDMKTTCERPAPFSADDAFAIMELEST